MGNGPRRQGNGEQAGRGKGGGRGSLFELPPAHFFHLIPFPMGAALAAPISSHFVLNEGSVIPTCCPHFVSIVGSVYPTRCPSISNGAVVFTPPPFPSISIGGGGIHTVEQTTSTLGSPLRGTLGEAHGSY